MDGRKRKENGVEEREEKASKIPAIAADEEEEEEETVIEVKEEIVMEVMKWLEEEITGRPSSSDRYYYHSSAFVTINGNEESCGPSFSDSASTVMASVDTRGVAGEFYFGIGGKDDLAIWPDPEAPAPVDAGRETGEEEEEGEEWLERVIGAAGIQVEEGVL